jgi:hypothetical protein
MLQEAAVLAQNLARVVASEAFERLRGIDDWVVRAAGVADDEGGATVDISNIDDGVRTLLNPDLFVVVFVISDAWTIFFWIRSFEVLKF